MRQSAHSPPATEPFYFGQPDNALFGYYHSPKAPASRNCAVVLCNPVGDEYIRFHRAIRQLAGRLATAGFPVLRFDYRGCGDSGGDCDSGDIDRWLSDIALAISEIRGRSRISKICLVGLRLGATLSTMTAISRGDIDSLVLWDPVTSGESYLKELAELHKQMLQYAHVLTDADWEKENGSEILGFPMTEQLQAGIEKIDLLDMKRKPVDHLLLLESNDKAKQAALNTHLIRLGATVKHLHQPNPQLWVWEEAFGKIQVPYQMLQSIVSWISEVYA